MATGKYEIINVSETEYALYEFGRLLTTFTRDTFRSKLEQLGRGSQWIGSILRLLNKKYPFRSSLSLSQQRSDLDRVGESVLVDYLRSKGYRVVKNLRLKDQDIINYLEAKGYSIEGLLPGDTYYRSPYQFFDEVGK